MPNNSCSFKPNHAVRWRQYAMDIYFSHWNVDHNEISAYSHLENTPKKREDISDWNIIEHPNKKMIQNMRRIFKEMVK